MKSATRVHAAIALSLAVTRVLAGDGSQSLFDEQTYHSLVAETKASRLGDVLAVVVQESASATSTTDLRAERDFDAGIHAQLTAIRHRSPLEHAITGGTNTASDGSGSTQRTGNLLAQLSVRVVEVRANGDLVVSGKQSLRINGEDQLITLGGIVRPVDVSADNTVLSNRIAEARIQFDGQGFVTDQSRPGLVAKILNFLGL